MRNATPHFQAQLRRLGDGCLLAAGAVAACAFIATLSGAAETGEPLSSGLVRARAELAARYIASVQLPGGLFEYEYDFLRGRFSDANNIVRQAGSTFVLAQYANHSGPSIAESASAAVQALALRSSPYEEGELVTDTGDPDDARLGATALALAAELAYFEATGDGGFEEARLAWLRGLEAVALPSAGMPHTPADETESSYNNGETWLALAEFDRLFPGDPTVTAMLAKAEPYLMNRYGRELDTQFAHWGMMAASLRYLTTSDPRYLDFLSTLTTAFLTDLRPDIDPDSNACSAVEGLAAAALAFVKGGRQEDPLFSQVVDRVEAELEKSLAMQILPGQTQISFGGERVLSDPRMAERAGAFLNGRFRAASRIDIVQHCLSALMRYDALRATLDRDR